MTINSLVELSHRTAVEKEFYNSDRNVGELLMLIVSELGEALEAHRNGYFESLVDFGYTMNELIKEMNSDNSNTKEKAMKMYHSHVARYFEAEIADVFIRLFDLCGYLHIDIEKHIEAKMAYNKIRPKKHGKKY